jgi:hypothetical protein
MSAGFDLGELRSLLALPPSARVWERLCGLVEAPAWEEAREVWLPYAADHLDRGWPDHLRSWPRGWWGREVAGSALARSCVFYAHGEQLWPLFEALAARTPPLRALRCSAEEPSAQGLVEALEALRPTLRSLALHGVPLQRALPGLLDGELLAGLEEVEIGESDLWDHDIAPLFEAQAEALRATHTLSLVDNPHLTRATWDALAGSPLAARLKSLTVNDIGELEALEALVGACGALEALDVSGPLGGPDAALWRLGALLGARLERLRIAASGVSASVLARLLEGLRVSGPLSLDISMNEVDAAVGRALSGPLCGRLRELYVIGGRGVPEMLAGMAGARLEALERLELSWVALDDAAVEALCGLARPALRRADLSGCEMTAAAKARLAGASWRGQVGPMGVR